MFYSKILLFGEYTLMFGSKALSIPFHDFYGRFSRSIDNKTKKGFNPEKHLRKFLEYLKNLDEEKRRLIKIDIERFESDLDGGMSVESNIPAGYGLGSSGALVAAVFEKYGGSVSGLAELKSVFSVMESFFHGKSSGFDPLVCYLDSPVLMDKNGVLKQITLPVKKKGEKGTLFLLDSKVTGETRPLVKWFIESYNGDDIFGKKIQHQLIPLNEHAIDAFVSGAFGKLSELFRDISVFTYDELTPMIPESLKDVWKNGLDTGCYQLKLCGSGGGGMMLGFTTDFDKTQSLLNAYTLRKVF